MPVPDDQLVIRPAAPADASVIAAMATQMRALHGDPTGHLTAEKILQDGFGDSRAFDLLVAEVDGQAVGYALYHAAYEPTYAARGLYLADLFVVSDWRRQGIGRRLIERVAGAARADGRTFVWWVARAGNKDAGAFYTTLDLLGRANVVAHAIAVD